MRNADYLRLQISSDKTFSSPALVIDSNIYVSLLQFKIPEGKLEKNIQYFWRINAVNAAGSGPWSPAWSFSVGGK